MKKFLFGVMVTFIGFTFSAFCFVYAVINPWTFNGISGLMGSFLGTGLLLPFTISQIILVLGLVICWFEAYCRK